MRGTKAKRLRKELEVAHPGRKYGGEVGLNTDAGWANRKTRRSLDGRAKERNYAQS